MSLTEMNELRTGGMNVLIIQDLLDGACRMMLQGYQSTQILVIKAEGNGRHPLHHRYTGSAASITVANELNVSFLEVLKKCGTKTYEGLAQASFKHHIVKMSRGSRGV